MGAAVYRLVRHNFIENNQLQLTSCFMQLPTEIVQLVSDVADVPVSIGDKSCRSSLDQFNLVFLISFEWTADCRTEVQVGPNHGEVNLGLCFFACFS